jgi:hypothetical protein
LKCGREIELISEYNKYNWVFIVNERSEELIEWKLLIGIWLDIDGGEREI